MLHTRLHRLRVARLSICCARTSDNRCIRAAAQRAVDVEHVAAALQRLHRGDEQQTHERFLSIHEA